MDTIAEETPVSPLRTGLTILGLIVLVAMAIVGGNAFGARDRIFGATAKPLPAAAARVAGSDTGPLRPAPATSIRSQPWWQGVATLHGDGAATPTPFTIEATALQWRAKWTCERGHLTIRSPSRPKPLIDADCSAAAGTGYFSKGGTVGITVQADGPWTLQVDQEVDVPLVEPPLPTMTAPGATVQSTATFYGVDQAGSGHAQIYRLAGGTYALRLVDFFVTPNSDLSLKLSPLPAPHTTAAFTATPSVQVAPLDITAGSINVVVPKDVEPSKFGSVVIWCERLHSVYAAASLMSP